MRIYCHDEARNEETTINQRRPVILINDAVCEVSELRRSSIDHYNGYYPPYMNNYDTEFNLRFYGHHSYKLKDFIKKVYFNKPYTIVIWADGDKTIVKCSEKSTYDKYTGFATCFIKKVMTDFAFPTFKKVVRDIIKEDKCKK